MKLSKYYNELKVKCVTLQKIITFGSTRGTVKAAYRIFIDFMPFKSIMFRPFQV